MFEHWHRVLGMYVKLDNPNVSLEVKAELLPRVHEQCDALSTNKAEYTEKFNKALDICRETVFNKMYSYNCERSEILGLFKAARFFNYEWIAMTPLASIQEEFECVKAIPRYFTDKVYSDLQEELSTYKGIADRENEKGEKRLDLWKFWTTYASQINTFYKAASYVVLYQPSSCSVERCISLLVQGFDDSQLSSLEDYKEYSCKTRFNDNKRELEKKESKK